MADELGLRVDTCTYEGLREGIAPLLELFRRLRIRATFFVVMGPDRSGMALFRVFRRRGFLGKMMRTGAVSMYGWKTMFRGTLLPAPATGSANADILRRIVDEGHEIGIHGWDHVFWHDHVPRLSRSTIASQLRRAAEAFERAVGRPPRCTASPGWICSEESLLAQEEMKLDYASDTRGTRIFRPVIRGRTLPTPQVPITLPTLDEALGREGVTVENYNDTVLPRLAGPQVYAMHSEAEGRTYLLLAEDLLRRAMDRTRILPLGELSGLRESAPAPIAQGTIPGRATTVTLHGP